MIRGVAIASHLRFNEIVTLASNFTEQEPTYITLYASPKRDVFVFRANYNIFKLVFVDKIQSYGVKKVGITYKTEDNTYYRPSFLVLFVSSFLPNFMF